MEKNKRFISILTVCLLSVLAILPLFSVTVSASASYTDELYYYPQTTLTVSIVGLGSQDFPGEHIHFPITYYSGLGQTTVNNTLDGLSEDSPYYAWQYNFVSDDESPTFFDDYTLIPQNSDLYLTQSDQSVLNRITFTIRNLYVFDDYFDDFSSSVTSSLWCDITSSFTGFFSSISDGSLYCRYREVGDELYSTVTSTSHEFSPFMQYVDNAVGEIHFPVGSLPTTSFRLDEYTSLPFLEEGKLYHIDELKLTYYALPFDGSDIVFNSRYYNVHNIDNIVVNTDKSNIHLPLRDFTSWLGTATAGFFTAEIAPGFSLGGIVMMCLAFALVIWFLKIFAGG